MAEVVIKRAEVLVFAAGVSCDEAARLQETARAIRVDSLLLKVRSQEVRGARRLHGSSDVRDIDASLIASLIADASLCAECLSRKAGIERGHVDDTVSRVGRSIAIITRFWRCDGCLKERVVFRLG